MRKIVLVLLAVLLPLSALAQPPRRPRRIAIFVSSPGSGRGVAAEYRFTSHWSAEVSAGREKHRSAVLFRGVFDLHTTPIDLVGRYHFLSESMRWRPYAGAGVRYIAAPDAPDFVQPPYDDRVSPQANGGVDFNINEAWSLRFDVKQLLTSDFSPFDEETKGSVSIGWRF